MAIQVSREEDRKLRLDGATARGQAALSKVLPMLYLTPHVTDLISEVLAVVSGFWIGERFIGRMEMQPVFHH